MCLSFSFIPEQCFYALSHLCQSATQSNCPLCLFLVCPKCTSVWKKKIMLFSASKIQTVQAWGPPSAKTADILHQYIPILAKKTCSLGAKEHYFKNQTKCLGRNKGLQTACPLLSQLSLSWRQKGSQNEGGHGSVPCCQWMAS